MLYTAITAGDLERVRALVGAGADVEERFSNLKFIPLHHAAIKGTFAQYLVDYRAQNKKATDHDGGTPMHLAAYQGHKEIVQVLMQHGANKNAVTTKGWTPLICATVNGRVAVVEYLLEQGCEMDHADSSGCTALHQAAANPGNFEVGQLLFRFGAKLDLRDHQGRTPVDIATRCGYHVVANAIANAIRYKDDKKAGKDDKKDAQ